MTTLVTGFVKKLHVQELTESNQAMQLKYAQMLLKMYPNAQVVYIVHYIYSSEPKHSTE